MVLHVWILLQNSRYNSKWILLVLEKVNGVNDCQKLIMSETFGIDCMLLGIFMLFCFSSPSENMFTNANMHSNIKSYK